MNDILAKVGQKAKFIGGTNDGEVVNVSTINNKDRTFTWMFRGCLRNAESFDDVEFIPPLQD